jgi:hypothetical protein
MPSRTIWNWPAVSSTRAAPGGRVGPCLRGQFHNLPERRFAAVAENLLFGTGQRQFDVGANQWVQWFVRLLLGVGCGRVLGAGSVDGLNRAADRARHDPFLAHFMIGQEAARQQGVSAVVERQVGQGRAAARDEKDQPDTVPLLGGIVLVLALGPHRPALELDHGVQRSRHPHAVDCTAHRPVRPFQHPLDAHQHVFGGPTHIGH